MFWWTGGRRVKFMFHRVGGECEGGEESVQTGLLQLRPRPEGHPHLHLHLRGQRHHRGGRQGLAASFLLLQHKQLQPTLRVEDEPRLRRSSVSSQDVTDEIFIIDTVEVAGESGDQSGSVLYTALVILCVLCILLVVPLTIAVLIHNIRTKSGSVQQLYDWKQ